ncbi:MAG: glycosyltransferase family 4 protein [Peptococcaceae bacterium]|nr:glycosyltransferase family 4 protein [Peptococcaceae bacterium]
MRIGMFTDTYYPQINGLATSVLMLSRHLRAKGHQVFVLTTTDPDAPKDEEDVYRLPSMPFLAERRMGIMYHPGLARMLKRLDLDLVHTHSEFAIGVFGRYMAKSLRLPMIHTMHTIYEDYTHYIMRLKMLEPLIRVVARKVTTDFCNSADALIVPTEKMRELLLYYGVNVEMTGIPTGIEIERFKPGRYSDEAIREAREEIGIAPGEKVLLYVGRVAEEKNIQELFYSLRVYLLQTNNVKFVLVGDGKDRARLENLSQELRLTDKVIFAGAKPWPDIGKYYQTGDVFVNTSRSEAQGLTYIEAMAAGLPVVARADPCLEGVLRDGENGYSFEDADGLVRAVDMILRNDLEHGRLSRGALDTAESFSAGTYADRVARAYDELLRNTSRRPLRKIG